MGNAPENKSRVWWNRLFVLLLLGVVAYYGLAHWRVIWLAEPATAREMAVVADAIAFANPMGPTPYSLASLPGNTNVYGPGFLWSSFPFLRLISLDPAVVLRLENALLLAVLLGLLACGGRNASRTTVLFAVALVYALFASSPSVAASPDILACVLYVAAWIVAVEKNFPPTAVVISILCSFLALLTKPYVVLVIPAIGSYLFLFRSVRAGFGYLIGVTVVFGAGLWVVNVCYPYYFFSTFAIHLSAANRDAMIAFNQWKELLLLAPLPCVGAILAARSWLISNSKNLSVQIRWREPLFRFSSQPHPYAWGAVMAVLALGLSLSWHDGAHMIYFWHLLLPLLVLLMFQHPLVHVLLLSVNLVLLLGLRPALPTTGTPDEWRHLQAFVARHRNVLLDPFLQKLQPETLGDPNRENAQSEYLLGLAIAANDNQRSKEDQDYGYLLARSAVGRDQLLLKRTQTFLEAQQRKIREGGYDGILLTEGIFYHDHLMPVILNNYQLIATSSIHSYFLFFRERHAFGVKANRVLCFERKK